MQLFYQPGIDTGIHFLDSTESHHCINVLRKKPGDIIDIVNGMGSFFKAQITTADPRKCEFTIVEEKSTPRPGHYIHIAIAPTKSLDRIEWFAEKCTELGIDEISFFYNQNSERKVLKLERVRKKVISAMKQSLKAYLPVLNQIVPFKKLVSTSLPEVNKYIAVMDTDNSSLLYNLARKDNKYLVVIGPEGDFTRDEIDLAKNHGFISISLGQSRLRTETAGIAACHILNLINS